MGCRFAEIDLEEAVWTIPGERMKSGKPHRVPLAPRAVAIVREMATMRMNEFVFPGRRRGKPLSPAALISLCPGYTPHGFRSSFKDWASEVTAFPDFVSEAALAHISADKVRAAYARSDLFQKRREMMEAWADFIEPPDIFSTFPRQWRGSHAETKGEIKKLAANRATGVRG